MQAVRDSSREKLEQAGWQFLGNVGQGEVVVRDGTPYFHKGPLPSTANIIGRYKAMGYSEVTTTLASGLHGDPLSPDEFLGVYGKR